MTSVMAESTYLNWLPDLVFLDLETTGGTPLHDRITEIALVRIENGEITDRWETLVNPGIPIPSFITRLTGITDDMVSNAPTFAEIAPKLYAYLEGMVLTAHNVRFDHGFLKAEFKRMGATLRQRTLCTVKLSRRLYPQHKGHGLDAIMRRHGLSTNARHRGMGDVQLMLDYLEVAKRDLGSVRVLQEIATLCKGPSLPPGLDGAFLDELPESPGVYLFYGENNLPLYIGKSINLKARVLNHFSSDHASASEMQIAQEVKRVEWRQTAGEFGALLLEERLVKQLQPHYNKLLRQHQTYYSIRLSERMNQTPWVKLVTNDDFHPSYFEHLYGMFRTRKSAMEVVNQIAAEHLLCNKLLGLETGRGVCFAHQLGKCTGVCTGKEKPDLHYLRLKQALTKFQLQSWPYQGKIGIKEHHQDSGITQVHIFDQWCFVATVEDDIQLDEALQSRVEAEFDLDTYKLLARTFKKSIALIDFQSGGSSIA